MDYRGHQPPQKPPAPPPMPSSSATPDFRTHPPAVPSPHMPQLPVHQPQQHVFRPPQHQVLGGKPVQPRPPPPAPVAPAAGRPGGPSNDAAQQEKCLRFIRTLVSSLPSNPADDRPERRHAVRQLVAAVLFGDLSIIEFTDRLQNVLQSQAQPHLVPFLERSIPLLRGAVARGEVAIEGLPQFVPGEPLPGSAGPMKPVATSSPPPPPVPAMPQPTSAASSSLRPSPAPPPQSVVEQPAPPPPQQALPQQPTANVDLVSQRPSAISYAEIIEKLQRQMSGGAVFVEEDVLTMIAEAAEFRLRELLTELVTLANHRVDQLRLHPCYRPLTDTRAQLKVLQEVDSAEDARREAHEKEALIRASKSKTAGKETQERAKQLQRADQEAARNRDSNAAARAALGASETPGAGQTQQQHAWTDATNPFGASIASGLSTTTHRPRTVRIGIRDLQQLMAIDPRLGKSTLATRMTLAPFVSADSIAVLGGTAAAAIQAPQAQQQQTPAKQQAEGGGA